MKTYTETAQNFFRQLLVAGLICLFPALSLAEDAPSEEELAFLVEEAKPINPDDPNAMGDAYFFGGTVPQNYQEAVTWYRTGAKEGNASAQLNLGIMYRNGLGVEKDNAVAVIWYQKAVEQQHAGAQYALGAMHHFGQGVPKDYDKAVVLYEKAADNRYS